MTTLKRRKIGATKLDVTELGLGGAPIGGFRATISDAEAADLIDAAYEGGVRYFDTSPFYGYGRSELRMGAALRQKSRDEYVPSTKVGRVMHAMGPGEKPPAGFRDNGLPGNGKLTNIREYVDTQAVARAAEVDASPRP